jgi:hypothetical protein
MGIVLVAVTAASVRPASTRAEGQLGTPSLVVNSKSASVNRLVGFSLVDLEEVA